MIRSLACGLLFLGAAAALAKPVAVERNSKTLEFSYRWPAEATASRVLNARFRRDMQTAYAETSRNAEQDKASAKNDKREFHGHEYSMDWKTAGQSARLLSLRGELYEYSGGAHPNHGTNALVWDRRTNMEMGIGTLFRHAATFTALTRAAYCKALDKERAKRRQGEKLDGAFGDCPKFSELAIVPTDRDRSGRFERLVMIASPYVAGPYVEGDYEITLPLTRQLIAGLKSVYRNSFEVQRQ